MTIGIKAVNPRRGATKETSLLLGKTTTRRRSALHRKIGAGLQQAAASTPSATQTRFLLEAMATSQKEEERWEKMWRILDRLDHQLENREVGQHRLQGQAELVAVTARKTEEHGSHNCVPVILGGTNFSVFGEKSAEKMVWGRVFGSDSHGLAQQLAHGVGDQWHNNCEQDVEPNVPWMFVGMPQQASTYPVSSEMGLTVAWDEEMQVETHTHEGLLQQLAQGGEALEELAEKKGDVVDETSKSDPSSMAVAMVMKVGSMEGLLPASVISVLGESPEKEQNAENVDATSAGGILSQDLVSESTHETNGAGEIISAPKVDDEDWEILQVREISEEEVEDYFVVSQEGAVDEVMQVELADGGTGEEEMLCGKEVAGNLVQVIVMSAVRWICDGQGLPDEILSKIQWDKEFSSNLSMRRGLIRDMVVESSYLNVFHSGEGVLIITPSQRYHPEEP